jgi:L-aspartate oxidase
VNALRGIDGISRSEVLVVGTGAAGLTAALGCSPLRVTVLTKALLGFGGSSPWAQGGIAAALDAADSPLSHVGDTLIAGAGLADPAAVEVLADLRERVERWMVETDDPLLDGPVQPPPGARFNTRDQHSASDPLVTRDGQLVAPQLERSTALSASAT